MRLSVCSYPNRVASLGLSDAALTNGLRDYFLRNGLATLGHFGLIES